MIIFFALDFLSAPNRVPKPAALQYVFTSLPHYTSTLHRSLPAKHLLYCSDGCTPWTGARGAATLRASREAQPHTIIWYWTFSKSLSFNVPLTLDLMLLSTAVPNTNCCRMRAAGSYHIRQCLAHSALPWMAHLAWNRPLLRHCRFSRVATMRDFKHFCVPAAETAGLLNFSAFTALQHRPCPVDDNPDSAGRCTSIVKAALI